MTTKPRETPRGYSPRTVITAQRRVLEMVAYQIWRMSPSTLTRLRVDRETGFTTWHEILMHVEQARRLKVKK